MEKTIAQQLNIKEFPFSIKDDNGNLIYRETSDGFWYRDEYDKYGNQTYHEDSDGFWVKYGYDDKHNRTYREYSSGLWERYEYDDKHNRTYRENSRNGVIFDKRPKPTCEGKVVDIDGKKYKLTEI